MKLWARLLGALCVGFGLWSLGNRHSIESKYADFGQTFQPIYPLIVSVVLMLWGVSLGIFSITKRFENLLAPMVVVSFLIFGLFVLISTLAPVLALL